MNRALANTLGLLFLLITCSAQTATDAKQIIRPFLNASGWNQALGISNAVVKGTMKLGDTVEKFTLKIDRNGRVRTEIETPHIIMIATPQGGIVSQDGRNTPLRIREASLQGASVLVPIFTPIVEIDSTAVTATVREQNKDVTTVSVRKTWNLADGNDIQRQDGQAFELNFDTQTGQLRSIAIQRSTVQDPSYRFRALIEYSDWRSAGPVFLPYHISESVAGSVQYDVTLDSVQFNVNLLDSDFSPIQEQIQ